MSLYSQSGVNKKNAKQWRTSMLSISPRKLASTDPVVMAWVAGRKEIIKQCIAYQPKQSKQNRRKNKQVGGSH